VLYRNFEIRGARFRDLVTALPGVKPVMRSLASLLQAGRGKED
jgi:hypothetical protein